VRTPVIVKPRDLAERQALDMITPQTSTDAEPLPVR
jgi:hypothetical protein